MNTMHRSYLSLFVIVILAAAFFFGSLSMLIFNIQLPLTSSNSSVQNKTPTVSILLYEGEISSSKYGFGTSANNLTSPGPTLRFKTSDIVNITVVNVGKMPHAFAITSAPRTGATVLFNAQIGSASNPLQTGQQGTVIFAPNNAGSSFYYICPVPGHAELGMYGSVVITTG
jgi:FtsP/CotA-like multicopper oxidase with cupredoxin domain